MKAAATLSINNGNPHENKLQRNGKQPQKRGKKVQFLKFIACPACLGDKGFLLNKLRQHTHFSPPKIETKFASGIVLAVKFNELEAFRLSSSTDAGNFYGGKSIHARASECLMRAEDKKLWEHRRYIKFYLPSSLHMWMLLHPAARRHKFNFISFIQKQHAKIFFHRRHKL